MAEPFRVTRFSKFALTAIAALTLGACVEIPSAPTVAVMPAPNKPFEVFQSEDIGCRQYAQQQIGASPSQAAANSTAAGGVAGAALGAVTGALISGGRGDATAAGAGIGLLVGTAQGSAYGAQTAGTLQHRYNIAYEQCMYAKGNTLPPPAYSYGYRYYSRPAYGPPPPPPADY